MGRKDVAGTSACALSGGTRLVHEDGGRNHDAPFDTFELMFFPRRHNPDLPMPHFETEPYECKLLQQEEDINAEQKIVATRQT